MASRDRCPKPTPQGAEIPRITGQRLGSASVTRGNVAGSHTPGNNAPETRLAGCPERIRTFESRDACQTLERLALNFHRRKEWTSAAKRVSLSPCRGKGRLARSGILPRWRWCHCGASAVAASGAVATEKGSSNVAQQNPDKDQVCARQEPREHTCEAWDHSLGFDPQRDQAGGRPRPA